MNRANILPSVLAPTYNKSLVSFNGLQLIVLQPLGLCSKVVSACFLSRKQLTHDTKDWKSFN